MDNNAVVQSYIENNYEEVSSLKDDGSVALIRNIVDGKYYVRKLKKVYNIDIYKTLVEKNIDGIPKIFEMYEGKDGLVIVEEYLEGETLDVFLQNGDAIGEDREAFISDTGIKLCKILEEMHLMNPPIIHRDIKPQNIMILGDKVYLLDFNISREFKGKGEKDTFVMGTPEFAAPEQFGFSESDARTDVYALGITIKYMADKLSVKSSKLNSIIKKAAAFDPRDRYQSVGELEKALMSQNGKTIRVFLRRFALPGFRQRKLTHIITAIFGYTFLTCILWDFHMGNSPYEGIYGVIYDRSGGIFLLFCVIMLIVYDFDYLGFRSKTCPWMRKIKNSFLKVILILAIDFAFLVMMFFLYVLFIATVCGGHEIA